ncbi:MAG: hypothetical protein V2A56_11385 [bacterium]
MLLLRRSCEGQYPDQQGNGADRITHVFYYIENIRVKPEFENRENPGNALAGKGKKKPTRPRRNFETWQKGEDKNERPKSKKESYKLVFLCHRCALVLLNAENKNTSSASKAEKEEMSEN